MGLGGDAAYYEEEVIDERTEYEEEEESYVKPRKNRQGNNVVSLHAVKEQAPRVMLVEPKSYEEVQEIADHLCSRRGSSLTCSVSQQNRQSELSTF